LAFFLVTVGGWALLYMTGNGWRGPHELPGAPQVNERQW
jgi:hypothetical protein